MCGILLQSAHGFRFCEKSKFAISHWLGQSPLTQCWRYCAACDNHTWHTWLVTSTMHEGVFSYNRQITADTPDFHLYDARRCVLIQQTNHSWHTWLVTSTMHEGVFSYNRQSQLTPLTVTSTMHKGVFSYKRQSQLTHLTCHLYDARRCVLIQQTNHSWHTWLVTSTMHKGVFSYNRQSQLTHLTCHVYDARRCVFIQQTITVDTPDLSPLRCTKVCFHTTDNHSWHP